MSASNGQYPATEVQPCARRRRFTAAYKRQIVEEAAQCEYGEVGALLRGENTRLQRKLEQAEAIIAAQKKLARLLEGQQEDETP